MQTYIQLQRNSPMDPWGFRLQGGTDFNSQLSVKKVTEGTPSYGQLAPGDAILGIGQNSTDRLTHMQAHDLIKRSGNVLNLSVCKGYGGMDERLQSIKPKGPIKFSPWKHQ
ncbi:PDZ and LIM domain protein 3-like [Ylistrum balloti]|uniref:PDZ and LIM domain protein 3-like n=1 Tax=Ylistrum balloti TaxID=509963 RepID=UPI002905BF5E|nr:PDZ and LIM domain protein 3-like [Ylistrum balloti]